MLWITRRLISPSGLRLKCALLTILAPCIQPFLINGTAFRDKSADSFMEIQEKQKLRKNCETSAAADKKQGSLAPLFLFRSLYQTPECSFQANTTP